MLLLIIISRKELGRSVVEIAAMEKFLDTNSPEVDLSTTGNVIIMLDDEEDGNFNDDSIDSYPPELFESVRYLIIIIKY